MGTGEFLTMAGIATVASLATQLFTLSSLFERLARPGMEVWVRQLIRDEAAKVAREECPSREEWVVYQQHVEKLNAERHVQLTARLDRFEAKIDALLKEHNNHVR